MLADCAARERASHREGASMRIVSRVCLISALTLVLSQLAVSAGAEPTVVRPGQAGARLAGAEEGPPVRGAEKESVATIAKGKQFEGVLGVEVRTRIQEGMGRIIDLLADRSGEVQAAVIEFGGFMDARPTPCGAGVQAARAGRGAQGRGLRAPLRPNTQL